MTLPEECHVASIRFQNQFLFSQHDPVQSAPMIPELLPHAIEAFLSPQPMTFAHPGCPLKFYKQIL